MNVRTILLTVLAVAALLALARPARAETSELTTVPSVDLQRYVGTWYEIARYPNSFQRQCASDTTATYAPREGGGVTVVNRCRTKEGKTKEAKGRAKVVDPETGAKLKVTFFWPFYGDYWIIGLDPEYRYAVVSEPDRRYLWILSRTPQMDPQLYDEAITLIRQKGLDPAKLLTTPHSSGSPE